MISSGYKEEFCTEQRSKCLIVLEKIKSHNKNLLLANGVHKD